MATSWTDLQLFHAGELELPPIFSTVDTEDAKVFYHDEVKRDFKRIINATFRGVGKLTSSTTDDFDIEEIENGSILKDTALEWNYLLIARNYATNLSNPNDMYAAYYQERKKDVEMDLQNDIASLTFADPDGVNQLAPSYTKITR